ncbi:MAG: cysteine desulfurase, partial [Thiomicrorhabdus sp.]|nr:cysteine desulfurase [Thiomicrorhabdus sp.]
IKRHPGNLNIRFPGYKSQDFLQSLQPNIAASTGSACNSGVEAPSYVLDAIGLSSDAAAECIRFSFGLNQSAEEIMEAVQIIHRTHANLGEISLSA